MSALFHIHCAVPQDDPEDAPDAGNQQNGVVPVPADTTQDDTGIQTIASLQAMEEVCIVWVYVGGCVRGTHTYVCVLVLARVCCSEMLLSTGVLAGKSSVTQCIN